MFFLGSVFGSATPSESFGGLDFHLALATREVAQEIHEPTATSDRSLNRTGIPSTGKINKFCCRFSNELRPFTMAFFMLLSYTCMKNGIDTA